MLCTTVPVLVFCFTVLYSAGALTSWPLALTVITLQSLLITITGTNVIHFIVYYYFPLLLYKVAKWVAHLLFL